MKSQVTILGDRLEMVRVFPAPRHRVFAAWVRVADLERWWGCAAMTRVQSTVDFRVGGRFAHVMQHPEAGEMIQTGTYQEIVVPERIVWTSEFCGVSSHVTVDFADLGAETRITLVQIGLPPAEFSRFVAEGSDEGFDKLARLLLAQSSPVMEPAPPPNA